MAWNGFNFPLWASLVAQMVKSLPAIQKTGLQLLGKDDLEKEMATHYSILAWRIPWAEEPGRLHTVHGVAELGTTEGLTHTHTHTHTLSFHSPALISACHEAHSYVPEAEGYGFCCFCL